MRMQGYGQYQEFFKFENAYKKWLLLDTFLFLLLGIMAIYGYLFLIIAIRNM